MRLKAPLSKVYSYIKNSDFEALNMKILDFDWSYLMPGTGL